jgi:hypothetical protein
MSPHDQDENRHAVADCLVGGQASPLLIIELRPHSAGGGFFLPNLISVGSMRRGIRSPSSAISLAQLR